MMELRSQDIHVQVLGEITPAAREILTEDCLLFVGTLCARFEARRQALLDARVQRATALDGGQVPSFLHKDHPASSDPHWKCAPIPADIQDRRVEITGPVDRKMVINGLNSGASVYMADFEDSTSPTWNNLMEGQLNLRDAVHRTISYTHPTTGKVYQLQKQQTATLFVRPRGWHLDEAHVLVNGVSASGSIFDFAVYLFHNHAALKNTGTGPYYYVPKMECHTEAALWNEVFCAAQDYLGLPVGTVRATALLETITAAFEMEEILYELRDHSYVLYYWNASAPNTLCFFLFLFSLGLNCGRWDYLFSYIKKFKHHSDKLAPDRSHLTMTTPLMSAYVKRLIYICHKRGTFAMGGMSAAIPIKNDAAANHRAMEAVRADKVREVQAGHDGTWVAHPALVQVAKQVFDTHMPQPNQIASAAGTIGARVSEADLLELPSIPRPITSAQLDHGVGIVLAYTEAWLRGVGCIPLHNAMEDAATAEISRAQIWQWRQQGAQTADDGQVITADRVLALIDRAVAGRASSGQWALAGQLVKKMLTAEQLDDFLTSVCYPHIVDNTGGSRL